MAPNNYRIIVFLSWRRELVEMTYPDETDAWTYRDDCGSYSQFRWSVRCKNDQDIVQMVVKHNSCINSTFMQPYCSNCQMRDKWRRPCTTAEDMFYALAIQAHNICDDAILPLVKRSYSINSETIAACLKHMPRPLFIVKYPKQNERTRKKILELKAKIKAKVYEQNMKADAAAVLNMQQQEQMALDALQNADPMMLLTLGSMDVINLVAELK